MADKEAVSQLLGMLSILFQDKKTSPEFYTIYQEFLKDIPDEAIISAIKECICECEFFPTIAKIREKAKPFIEHIKWLENQPDISECKKGIIRFANGEYGCDFSTCQFKYSYNCLESQAVAEIKKEKGV
jgi:hypothetical protein